MTPGKDMGELRFFGIEGGEDTAPLPGEPSPPEDAGGYVKVYRKALESPELAGDAVSLGLFVTLLLLARWRPGSYKREPLQAGQLAVTLQALCKQTGLSMKQVRTRLEAWHEAGTIKANQRANRYHVITICNYEQYQARCESKGQTEGQTKGKPRANQGQTDSLKAPVSGHPWGSKKERRKEGRNPLAPSVLARGFEGFWEGYPKKRSKGQAEKAWRKLAPSSELCERITAALEAAKSSPEWRKDAGQFIPYPATWLNSRGWEDEWSEPPATATAPDYYRAPECEP